MSEQERKSAVTKGKDFQDLCEKHAKFWFPEKFFSVKREYPGDREHPRMDFYVQTKTAPEKKSLVIECKHYPSEVSRLGERAIDQILVYKEAYETSWQMIWISDVSNPPLSFSEKAKAKGIAILPIDASFLRRERKPQELQEQERGFWSRLWDWLTAPMEDSESESSPRDSSPVDTIFQRMEDPNSEYYKGILPTVWEMYTYIAEHIKEDYQGDVEAAFRAIWKEVGFDIDVVGDPPRPPGGPPTQKIPPLIEPEIKVDEKTLTETYGRFTGEPCERGFGTTLGNGLRRVLLSSLPGAAITKVHINGVLHEFSTVAGMTEDITDLLLNLKEIRFRLEETDRETIRLDVQGQGEVTAADLTVGAQIVILNPDKHLASLDKDASLEFEADVQTGRGYVAAERHKSEDDPIGTIPLDAVFSPVRKVKYAVTNARIGQRTDYERLTLEVWTDGSLRPEKAVAEAARILQDQLGVFIGPGEEQEWRIETSEEPAVVVNENLLRPIEELNLSVRSANCLQSANLRYVYELVQRTEPELLKTKNFGRKSLNEIKETLQSIGLQLGLQLGDFPSREELDRRRTEHDQELRS